MEIPIDLRIFLYKGASAENLKTVYPKIAEGEFGKPIEDRIDFVQRIHGELNAKLVSGKSRGTIKNIFNHFRNFIRWADTKDIELSIINFETPFREWSDYLFDRVLKSEILMCTAFAAALSVNNTLVEILEQSPRSLITTTRLCHDAKKNIAVMDEQNLSDIFKFGNLLIDIVNCLPLNVVYGSLPIKMVLRDGTTWCEWSGSRDISRLATFSTGSKRVHDQKKLHSARSAREKEHSTRTRHPIINLRLQTELLIFIAQTGMNLAQARQLRLTQASYSSSIDGYQVRAYKGRRGGEVLFEIFSDYRDHFDKFLAWRKEIFKDTTGLLFPFCYLGGDLTPETSHISCQKMINICKRVNIKYFGPRELRRTRINWLLRQSRNPDLTADQAQHTKQVLYRSYERPSLQIAKVELIKFWKKNDPTLQQVGPAPAPGICDGNPMPIEMVPPEAPKPDCVHPNGCLFCEHHRDIDSEDYVWSLASMKHFNALLVTKYPPIQNNKPVMGGHIDLVLEMLVSKLKWFESSNQKRKKWTQESFARCNEGDFHPHWGYLIESVEA